MKRLTGIELAVLALLAMLLGACSGSPEKDYRAIYESQQTEQQQTLDVPPDLNAPLQRAEMQIPGIGREQASYSESRGQTRPTDQVLASARNVQFVREGNMHWLRISLSPQRVWNAAHEFMQSLGFEIVEQNPKTGIMETNWKERREKNPSNWVENLLAKIGSSGYQDRYRVRLERGDDQSTRVFITHRGLKEVVVSGGVNDIVETAWEPTAPDPGLEAELLQRFLVFLGGDVQQAEQIVADAEPAKRTRLTQQADEPVLQVNETFARTWRRVGLALDRVGLKVEDRNRTEGLYYIRLTDEFKAKEEKGFWASLLGDNEQGQMVDALLLRVTQQGEHTDILVRDRNNDQVGSALAERLLKDMEVHLR